MRVAVIGSGPSGVSCARALIRRGLVPTVIDIGETLPRERQVVVDRMAKLAPTEWATADRDTITENPTISGGDIPKKMIFGSEFYFAKDRAFDPVIADAGLPAATFALGGYTVAWGAAVMPTHDSDMQGWPISAADLEPSYRQVLSKLPLSARHDSLESAFPLFTDRIASLPMSSDSHSLLADLARVSTDANAPFLCGQARLAVHASGCRQCGLCLSGCVYGAIYSLGPALEELAKTGALRYQPGQYVEKLEEDMTEVKVVTRQLDTGTTVIHRFDYVFVAAGAIQSTRIVLSSLQLFNRAVLMKDSQKFILPLLRAQRHPLAWPNGVALASVFLDYKAPKISSHWIHAQISSVNDYVLRRFHIAPYGNSLWRRLLAPIYERLMIAYCGLHSDHSSGMTLTLKPNGSAAKPTLHLQRHRNPEATVVARKVSRYLARRALHARTMVVTPAMVLGRPGGGNHFGGSLPMRSDPRSRLDTDILGRLPGWRRIHVVDGAVLPAIPATTLALLQMANADRIATACQIE